WPGVSLTLEPLSDAGSQLRLDELAAEWPLPPDARRRIADAAEGNPLFVEQMVAMLAEHDTATVEMPPTIQALLAARLDRLEPAERAALECAAVIGKEFWRGAVAVLSHDAAQGEVAQALLSLVRKELVRPEPSAFLGEDGFRFRHALIRDATYAAIPKSTRADLHERFAGWFAQRGGEDELLGYHLEQAYLYRAELVLSDSIHAARAAGNTRLEWYGRLERAARNATANGETTALVTTAESAVLVFQGLGDDLGLARAWRRLGLVAHTEHRYGDATT